MSLTYSWKKVNEAVDSLHRADAILNVLMDAFPGQEHGGLVGALWAVQREIQYVQHVLEEQHERPEETDAPKWDADGEVGLPVEDEEGEDDGDSLDEEDAQPAEATDAGRFTRSDFLTGKSLRVELKEEHPNGSATYTIHSDDDTLQRVFEAFFVQALLRGVESAEEENKKFISLKRAAEELERFLRVWEDCGDLDYDPSVKEKREALTAALY